MNIHNGHDDDPRHTTPYLKKRMISNIPASLTLQKQPRPPPIGKEDLVLCLRLLKAEGIDPPGRANPSVPKRLYCAVFSGALEPRGVEFWSQMVQGRPDPCWNAKWDLKLQAHPNCSEYFSTLRVEVLGFSSDGPEGPGTSTGLVLVGRAEVRLPTKLCKQKFHMLQLLRPEGARFKAEGTIGLTLELMPLNEAERRAKAQLLRNFGYN
ncbi:hypothetical protein TIFTF001_010579 [Ficus carica]|uniref:C2 domain-containing protein n=1 Tax=Ficus carica TaxID=3494 RepID=A0AA88CZZ9_FICCA|nr:hypothetical protein TIFTF001_010579 [Ficus carica]